MGVLFTRLASVLLIAVGFVTLPTPLPIGIFAIAFGVALLVSSSPWMRRRLRRFRARNPQFNARMERAEPMMPGPIAETLRRTRPKSRGKPEA